MGRPSSSAHATAESRWWMDETPGHRSVSPKIQKPKGTRTTFSPAAAMRANVSRLPTLRPVRVGRRGGSGARRQSSRLKHDSCATHGRYDRERDSQEATEKVYDYAHLRKRKKKKDWVPPPLARVVGWGAARSSRGGS